MAWVRILALTFLQNSILQAKVKGGKGQKGRSSTGADRPANLQIHMGQTQTQYNGSPLISRTSLIRSV